MRERVRLRPTLFERQSKVQNEKLQKVNFQGFTHS